MPVRYVKKRRSPRAAARATLLMCPYWELAVVCHLGNMLALQQAGDELSGALALHLGVGPKDDAVRQHGLGQRLDVVGQHVASTLHCGQRLARMEEVEGSSSARAEGDFRVAPCPADEPSDVLAQLWLHEHLTHLA